jgi:hypothetical protein
MNSLHPARFALVRQARYVRQARQVRKVFGIFKELSLSCRRSKMHTVENHGGGERGPGGSSNCFQNYKWAPYFQVF